MFVWYWYRDLHEFFESWYALHERHRASYPWWARARMYRPDPTFFLYPALTLVFFLGAAARYGPPRRT
jgi:hypothetical protein